MKAKPAALFVAVALSAAGCGPSEQQTIKAAEEKRIDCLDKVCEGDAPPKLERPLEQTVMKLNGEYFMAPRAYTKGFSGLAFYWPSKTPVTGRADQHPYPEQGKNYSDVAIEIFLRHHDGKTYGPVRYERLRQAEREGRLLRKASVSPGLEQWRTQEKDNSKADLWYVATKYVHSDPEGAVLSCREVDPSYATCGTGFIWRPGIAGDTRFRAEHAVDWPEIYEEVQRVLHLLKKV